MAGELDSDTPETINREQQDEGQAQDVASDALRRGANSALHPEPGLGESSRAPGNRAQIIPDDVPDLVDTMNGMVQSGVIDNGAYAGEPQHDDEEDLLGDTEDDGDGEDDLLNPGADGSEDPMAVPVDLDTLADDGDDPLGKAASEHGLEDEDADDDAEDDDLDDPEDDADEDDDELDDDEDEDELEEGEGER